jgi:excisionase family DNA binding protein
MMGEKESAKRTRRGPLNGGGIGGASKKYGNKSPENGYSMVTVAENGQEKQNLVGVQGICNQPPSPSRKRLYTIKESGEYLGRSPWGVRELIWAGKLPYVRDGRAFFIDIKDLDSYVERNKNTYQY